MKRLRIVPGPAEVASAAAAALVETVIDSVRKRGEARIALSGGPDVVAALVRAASAEAPWDRVRFMIADDKPGAPADLGGRYRPAWEAFFSKIHARPGHVVRFWSEGGPAESVVGWYEQCVLEMLDLPAGSRPEIDLAILGLGDGGSVGAFGPGVEVSGSESGFTALARVGDEVRFTLSERAIAEAGRVLVLGSGPERASSARRAIETSAVGERAEWILDLAAAGGETAVTALRWPASEMLPGAVERPARGNEG